MNDIAGIPYFQARFDDNGATQDQVALPAGITDLFVISHGWNNDESEAQDLYRGVFQSFVAVTPPGALPGRQFAILGIIWPSKRFDELVAVSGEPGGAQGSAALGGSGNEASSKAVAAKLDQMKLFFTSPAQLQVLEQAKSLLPKLEDQGSARRAFVEAIRSLLDPSAANKDDASDTFFKTDGNQLMQDLKVVDDDLEGDLAAGGSASMPLGVGQISPQGGAAGLTDLFSGFKAAAMNVLNFTTYYEMKRRAGIVGKDGLAKLLDQLDPQVSRIHLIGHSFGGRVVTAAAANSTTAKIMSMSLLQAAFSHNGFSQSKGGFFRSVVDSQRVKGPILLTHTKNDKAVGIAYPLASRISGETACALGDENDKFGGLGRNGVQQMNPGERTVGQLLPVGAQYTFAPSKFFNLEASTFIKGHSDIKGREVAYALRCAIQ